MTVSSDLDTPLSSIAYCLLDTIDVVGQSYQSWLGLGTPGLGGIGARRRRRRRRPHGRPATVVSRASCGLRGHPVREPIRCITLSRPKDHGRSRAGAKPEQEPGPGSRSSL